MEQGNLSEMYQICSESTVTCAEDIKQIYQSIGDSRIITTDKLKLTSTVQVTQESSAKLAYGETQK
jgi:hypothetical protein